MAHSAARTIIAPRLKLYDYLILRLVVPIMAYLPLSLSYTLVSLAFGLPFGGKYVSLSLAPRNTNWTRLLTDVTRCRFSPAGGFFMTFLYVYLGMTALGLSLEAMITLLTPKFIPFFVFTLVSIPPFPSLLRTIFEFALILTGFDGD